MKATPFAAAVAAALLMPAVSHALVNIKGLDVAASQITIKMESSRNATGYFTILRGANKSCGNINRIIAGQAGNALPAYRFGSIPLRANQIGSYTVRNVEHNSSYTVCVTDGENYKRDSITTPSMATYVNPVWASVGEDIVTTGSVQGGTIENTQLIFAPDGTPMLAYGSRYLADNFYADILRLEDGIWESIGERLPKLMPGIQGSPPRYTLAYAPNGTLYYVERRVVSTYERDTHVSTFNGRAWSELPAPQMPYSPWEKVRFAFMPDGTPRMLYIQWSSAGNWTYEGILREFDGQDWLDLGTPGMPNSSWQKDIALAVGPDGNLYAAMYDSQKNKAVVKMFDGLVWQYLSDTGIQESAGSTPNLAFAPNGDLYLKYTSVASTGSYQFHTNGSIIAKFDGTQWVNVGNMIAGTGNLAIAPDNTPYFMYTDWSRNTGVKKFDGTEWVPASNGSLPSITIESPDYRNTFAFSPDGTPYISYGLPGGVVNVLRLQEQP